MNEQPLPDAPGTSSPAWLQELRAPFLSASVMSVVYGGAVVWRAEGTVDALRFALCVLGVALAHLGSNVANDYYDHLSGTDAANVTPTPFSGGSRVIQRGLMSPQAVLIESMICFTVAGAIGVYLNAVSPGNTVLWIGVAGVLLGFFYTAAPIRLSYRGLGELAIAIAFGPLAAAGTQYVLMGHIDATGLVGGSALGLLVALILYANEVPDIAADRSVGKKTLPVLIGPKWSWAGYVVLLVAASATLIAGVLAGALPALALIALAPLPAGVWAAWNVQRHAHNPLALIPACGTTILQHVLVGMLLSAGIVLAA